MRPTADRDALIALVAALALGACGDRNIGADAEAGTSGAHASSDVPRCEVREPARPSEMAGEPVVAVAGGPHGARYFSSANWWDADAHGAFAMPEGASVAWDGAAYVVASRRGIDAYGPAMAPLGAHRALPGRVCAPAVLETGAPGQLALVYERLVHGDECESGSGTLWLQRLVERGAPAGPAVQVGRGTDGRDRLILRSARVDAGRVVVAFDELDANDVSVARYAVHALDGRELAQGEGTNVACPRAGCVRVLGRNDPGANTAPDQFSSQLRALRVGRGTLFNLLTDADRVTRVAVAGDRVLVEFVPPASSGDARSLAVIDADRQELLTLGAPAGGVGEGRAPGDATGRTIGTSSSEVHPAQAFAVTASGFAVVPGASTFDDPMVVRTIDCRR